MHAIDTAAPRIKLNMPLGLKNAAKRRASRSDRDAWDVAAYVNAREPPRDPRFSGSVPETRERYHDIQYDYYGSRRTKDGHLLGAGDPLRR